MSKLQLSQVGAVWNVRPVPEQIAHGGGFGRRAFAASAVQVPDCEPGILADTSGSEPAEPVQVLDCGELDRQCTTHTDDYGDIIHRGPQHKVSIGDDENLLTHRLIRWGDNAPGIEYVDGGNWSELDLAATDALMGGVARQLTSLLDTRTHLAAATGASGAGLPPELVLALAQVCGATVTASLAGLQTNPRDVAEQMHRTIDNAQGWHLAEVGEHSEVQAYADSRFGTAIKAMADAINASEHPARMSKALRTAVDMVISEAGGDGNQPAPAAGFDADVPTTPPKSEKAQQGAYRPPLAADCLPEIGIDDSTVIELHVPGLDLKAGIHVSDDEEATLTVAVWTEGRRDGTDLDALDAERVAAALPVFTEQFQALARRLAEQPVPYSVTEQAEDAK